MAENENSLEVKDSHKRAIELAKAPLKGLVKGVIEEIEKAPGASIAKNVFNESFKGLIDYFSQVKRDINEERFFEFHKIAFVDGVSEEKKKELLKSLEKIKDEDYLNIIEAALKDEEAGKVKYYAKLIRIFLEKNYSSKQKVNHLHSFKSLREDDFQLLKRYYEILKELKSGPKVEMNAFAMSPSPKNKLDELASSGDPIVASGIQRLISAGYVSGSTEPPWPSEYIYDIWEVLD